MIEMRVSSPSSGKQGYVITIFLLELRKRTKTIHRELNPEWNEKFQFECANSTDRIKGNKFYFNTGLIIFLQFAFGTKTMI